MKRISNKTKDKLAIIGFLCFMFCMAMLIAYLFMVAVDSITKVNAEEITTELNGKEQMNKYYTEETIKAEMYYLSAWEEIESMAEEEYAETFYKGVQNV